MYNSLVLTYMDITILHKAKIFVILQDVWTSYCYTVGNFRGKIFLMMLHFELSCDKSLRMPILPDTYNNY